MGFFLFQTQFHAAWLLGGLDVIHIDLYHHPYWTSVFCFPLLSLMRAINQTTVDYFSLDVEGTEPHVLRSLPYDQIDIRLISVEYNHCGEEVINDILVPAGYQLLAKLGADVIYGKKSWLQSRKKIH